MSEPFDTIFPGGGVDARMVWIRSDFLLKAPQKRYKTDCYRYP